MKKFNFIIGKKQIILTCLTLILGTAIYVNYVVSDSSSIPETKVVENTSKKYGTAAFVSETADGEEKSEESTDYFEQARLDRLESRDKAVQTLKSIMDGGDSTEEEQAVAGKSAEAVSNYIEKESNVESLLKAAGFEDAVVYLDEDGANIVVKSGDLDADSMAQIKDILLSEVNVKSENIRIFDVK